MVDELEAVDRNRRSCLAALGRHHHDPGERMNLKPLFLLALLLIVPGVSAAHGSGSQGGSGLGADGGGHIHTEYRVPFNVALGGLGGGLFQGEMVGYATYRGVVPDNDEGSSMNEATVRATVGFTGPGTNLDGGAFTVALISTTCNTAVLVASSAAVNTGVSHATATWDFAWDDTAANPESCTALIRVQRSGALAFTVDIPMRFINSDPQPTAFQDLTGLEGIEALALLLSIVLLWVVLALRAPTTVSIPAAVALLLLGVLMFFFTSSLLVLLLGFTAAVGATAKLVQLGFESREAKRPKRAFD